MPKIIIPSTTCPVTTEAFQRLRASTGDSIQYAKILPSQPSGTPQFASHAAAPSTIWQDTRSKSPVDQISGLLLVERVCSRPLNPGAS